MGAPTSSTGWVKRYFQTASWMKLPEASFTAAPRGMTELCARLTSFFTSAAVISRRVLLNGDFAESTSMIGPYSASPSSPQER